MSNDDLRRALEAEQRASDAERRLDEARDRRLLALEDAVQALKAGREEDGRRRAYSRGVLAVVSALGALTGAALALVVPMVWPGP